MRDGAMNASGLRKLHNRQPGQCTWCGEPVGKYRRTWCGDACVEAFKLANDWQHVRRKVEKRDRGVCATCGCDTDRMVRLYQRVPREDLMWLMLHWSQLGFDGLSLWGLSVALWQADHIVPRCRGGGNELTNLRTLCVPCHKRETARLAAERKAERRLA